MSACLELLLDATRRAEANAADALSAVCPVPPLPGLIRQARRGPLVSHDDLDSITRRNLRDEFLRAVEIDPLMSVRTPALCGPDRCGPRHTSLPLHDVFADQFSGIDAEPMWCDVIAILSAVEQGRGGDVDVHLRGKALLARIAAAYVEQHAEFAVDGERA